MTVRFFWMILILLISLSGMAQTTAYPNYTSTNSVIPSNLLYGKNWNDKQLNYPLSNTKAPKLYTFKLTQNISSDFVFPVKTKGKIISKYGRRSSGFHTGTDYKLNLGDTVVSSFKGKVRMAKWFSGYGYVVVVRHLNGLETVYGHLSKILVDKNQWVEAGTTVGLGGATGRATTSHLHFEMRIFGVHFNSEKLIDYQKRCLKSNVVYYFDEQISTQPTIIKQNSTYEKPRKPKEIQAE